MLWITDRNPWLASTCGICEFCRRGEENLCDKATFTGYHIDGGYAEFAVADERYCHTIPAQYHDVEAAPLLCAGLIGFRSLRAAGDPKRLGLYGFGGSAHIVAQIAKAQGREVFAFTRPNDVEGQRFAVSLGAVWAGGSDQPSPNRSMPQSSSLRWVPWFRRRSGLCGREGASCAPAFT